MIEANLGAPLNTIETDAEFAVAFSSGDAGWFARIDMRSGAASSSRTLPAVKSCLEASDAAALVVAIALDPTAAAVPGAPPTEPEVVDPEPEATLSPVPVPEPEPLRPPRPPADVDDSLALGGHLGVAGGVRYGSLDRVLGVLSLRGGLLLPRARISLEAVVAPRRTVAIDGAAQVRFTHWGVAASGCWRIPVGAKLAVEPCGALELGQTRSATQGLDNAQTQAPIWIAVRAGPHLTWRFSRHAGLWTGVEALVPLTRPAYEVGGAGTVAHVLPAGIHTLAGVEIRLGRAP